MNTDQSVIDIKFEDVLARDLKAVLGKTLDGLVKDLIASSKAAVGTGQLTNLGIIPTKEGAVGGIRFAVDTARRNDVQIAMKNLLGEYAERAGVGKVASVSSNTGMQAFSEPFIRLPNDDPAFAKSVLDFIDRSGGEVLWSENYKDYTALRVRIPHSHLAGNKLSTMQQLNQYNRESGNIIANSIKAEKIAAAAESIRKKDTGYISETDLAEQEERRRQLGIVTDEDEKPDIASAQDKKAYFTKSLAALTGILAVLGKIASTLWKLAEQSIQTHYEAMSYGVDPNRLASFQNVLEDVGIPKSEANKAMGAIVGGLINRFNLDEGLIQRLAPVMGEDLAGTVSQMLSKSHDPFGALKLIMENARGQVSRPGSVWDVQSMANQLGVFGPSFLGYMNWLDRQENPTGKSFYDFLGYDPAKYLDESAETALNLKDRFGRAKHFLQNVGRNILSSGTRLRGAAGVYQRLGIDPSEMSLEDLIDALKTESSPDINSYYRKFGTGMGPDGAPYYRQELRKDLNVLEKALERLQGSDILGFLDPFESKSGSLVENMAYGFGGTGAGFGGTIYNEIDNSVNTSSAAGGGSMDISLNIRGGGKDMGTYPLEINANNMITIDYWS